MGGLLGHCSSPACAVSVPTLAAPSALGWLSPCSLSLWGPGESHHDSRWLRPVCVLSPVPDPVPLTAGWQDGHRQEQTPLHRPHTLAVVCAMWPLAGALGGTLWPPPHSPEVRGQLPACLLGTDSALQHVSPPISPQLRDLDPLTPSSLEAFTLPYLEM